MWTSGSRWFFHRHDSRLYFVIRTGWGRFVIVDLQSSTVLRQPLAALVASIEGSGSAWAVETLARACAQLDRYSAQAVPVEGEAPVTPDVSEILSAANVVIAARLHDAVPHLRRLEQSDYIGSAGGWWDIENRYADGEINPFNEQQHTLRRASHTALRQLGERPAELPATSFRYTRPKKLGEVVPVPALPAPRADRVGELRPGMTVPEILAAVGAPDYVNFRETAWEYDMDADDPYTLRVYFKDKKTLDRTERLRPPAWMSGDRTRQIFGGG
jgi:hypothetical protein